MSFIRRMFLGRKKDKATISYGNTVQVEHRRKNFDRRIEELRKTIHCDAKEPCEKLGTKECYSCMELSNPHEMAKINFIVSQGQGELGERYPVNPRNHAAWSRLLTKYSLALKRNGANHPLTITLAKLVDSVDTSFLFRSTTQQHTRTDVASPEELLTLLLAMMNMGNNPYNKLPIESFGKKQ